MLIVDYVFSPDSAIKALETEIKVLSSDFFEFELSEMEENPLLKCREEDFVVNHEL